VGMSTCMRQRLMSHASEKIAFFDGFSVLTTETIEEARYLESLFIKTNKPEFNKVGTKSNGPRWLEKALNGQFENEICAG